MTLTDPVPREAVLVVNAHSRRGRDLFREAKEKLEAAGISLRAAHAVRRPKELIPTMRRAVKSGVPLVIVGGGAGSLSCTVDDVVDRACAFALLDWKRVASGKSVAVRVDLGGGRVIKKKTR